MISVIPTTVGNSGNSARCCKNSAGYTQGVGNINTKETIMAWNPSEQVKAARDLARKWNQEQIIILSIDGEGRMGCVTYGETLKLCNCAKKLGNVAFDAISIFISKL